MVKREEQAPKHHSTIESLSATGCKTFLSCSTIGGFRCTEDANELKITSEIRVYPGELLKVLGIVKKTWRVVEGTEITEKPSTTFLKCYDRKKRQLYLPFAHPGKFCALYEKPGERNVVFQIGGLLDLEFPVLARLVFGWPPPHFKQFTGFIRLVGLNRPDTVVLYNMIQDKCLVLEVPNDIGCNWRKAENLEALKGSQEWKSVIDKCVATVYPFLITMKCLDVRYFRLPKPDPESGEKQANEEGVEAVEKKRKMGRMARSLDMLTFNLSEVFPRLLETEEKKISDSWAFTFRDPERENDPTANGIKENAIWMLQNNPEDEDDDEEEDESVDGDPSEMGVKMRKKKGLRRSANRTDSVANYTGALHQMSLQESIAMPRREYTGTIRETRERQILSREANC